MKTKKSARKELTAKILEKIQEALGGLNENAVKKVTRSAENTAKKLARKFTAVLDKDEKKAKKAGKRTARKTKKAAKTQKRQNERATQVAAKKAGQNGAAKPAETKTPVTEE